MPRCLIPILTTYFLFQPPLQVKWAPSEDAADGNETVDTPGEEPAAPPDDAAAPSEGAAYFMVS